MEVFGSWIRVLSAGAEPVGEKISRENGDADAGANGIEDDVEKLAGAAIDEGLVKLVGHSKKNADTKGEETRNEVFFATENDAAGQHE